MGLDFAGASAPPLSVFSFLFSASYPQDRRSYYLFFNYLFFNYLYGGWFVRRKPGGGGGFVRKIAFRGGVVLCEENSPKSHKPVEIGDLRAQSDSRGGEAGRCQDGPVRPSGAILEAEKGYSARRRGLGTAFHPAGRCAGAGGIFLHDGSAGATCSDL